MDYKTIGSKIKECRKACNLSQTDLADKVGISPRYLSDIERGEKMPKLATFINILNAMDASADYILADILNSAYKVRATELEKSLEELADKISKTVLKTGKSVTLEPMMAYERKIIHNRLQSSDKIKTYSIGEEPHRKVVISKK